MSECTDVEQRADTLLAAVEEDVTDSTADNLRPEGIANAAGVLSGPAPRALRAWVDVQQDGSGESVFPTDLEPWVRGDVVDPNAVCGSPPRTRRAK